MLFVLNPISNILTRKWRFQYGSPELYKSTNLTKYFDFEFEINDPRNSETL